MQIHLLLYGSNKTNNTINGITMEEEIHSHLGGDSDAEDGFDFAQSTDHMSTTRENYNSPKSISSLDITHDNQIRCLERNTVVSILVIM